jgi:hypothetical protein
VLIVNNMANMLPEDFVKMGNSKRALGVITKIFPPLCIFIHYIILIGILVLWVFYCTGSCPNINDRDCQTLDLGYNHRILVLNIVNSVFWIFLHYFGAVIRDVLYQEPFMYAKRNSKYNIIGIFLNKLGP